MQDFKPGNPFKPNDSGLFLYSGQNTVDPPPIMKRYGGGMQQCIVCDQPYADVRQQTIPLTKYMYICFCF